MPAAKSVESDASGFRNVSLSIDADPELRPFRNDPSWPLGTWGADTDDLVAIQDHAGGQRYYPVQDGLRSVRALVRADGTWVAGRRYRVYGGQLVATGSDPFPLRFRWAGAQFDEETGLYYLRNRYYDPGLGRFTQEDPIGFGGGGNLYGYSAGNPTAGRDPSGLAWLPDFQFALSIPVCGSLCDRGRDGWIDEVHALWDEVYSGMTGGFLTDCGRRNCGTAVTILSNPDVQYLFRQLMRETRVDGREGGTWLISVQGLIRYTPITVGTRETVGFGRAPVNAIAEVHTHPADAAGPLSLGGDNARIAGPDGQALHYFVLMPEGVYALDYYARRGRPSVEWRWNVYRWTN